MERPWLCNYHQLTVKPPQPGSKSSSCLADSFAKMSLCQRRCRETSFFLLENGSLLFSLALAIGKISSPLFVPWEAACDREANINSTGICISSCPLPFAKGGLFPLLLILFSSARSLWGRYDFVCLFLSFC
ncbi:unknown protein [Desulfotalea psychrophila LSv54]|uniref:Uncharacterized protein n=1 Tax=Desulfotalea psychrophila (strain LSv54 / DSM 12343) TaxID=177439 RepID=Q6AS48_DESPS|nr:unknown protein [Desulfotalea psychrophila LSv54]